MSLNFLSIDWVKSGKYLEYSFLEGYKGSFYHFYTFVKASKLELYIHRRSSFCWQVEMLEKLHLPWLFADAR
jgi:hypothetical protein